MLDNQPQEIVTILKSAVVESAPESVESVGRFLSLLQQSEATDDMRYLLGDIDQCQHPDGAALSMIQRFILKESSNKKEAYGLLRTLSRWIEAGNEKGLWRLCVPPIPVFIKAPVSPFGNASRNLTSQFSLLQKALCSSVDNSGAEEGSSVAPFQLGQLILSAILFGDLHDTRSLKALLKQCKDPVLFNESYAWIDLCLENGRCSGAELKRWFPDKLTELLFYSLPEGSQNFAATILEKRYPTAAIYQTVSTFLKAQGISKNQIPLSFKALFEVASYQRMLDSSSVVAGYASGALTTHPLKPQVWQRLHGFTINDDTQQAGVFSEGDADEASKVGVAEPLWLDDYRKSVLSDNLTQLDRVKASAAYLDRLSGTKSATDLVPRWVHSMLTEGGKNQTKLALSTIKGYLSSTGKRLMASSGETDITGLDVAGFEDLYWLVLDDVESGSLRRAITKGLGEFHYFLEQSHNAPSLSESMVLGVGNVGISVDANIISLDEYEQCLDALKKDQGLNAVDEDLGLIAALIFIVGFRCGTRRSEILKLRLADYHPSSRTELLIRPWSNRRLKSKSSTRKLPIHALLTKTELKMLDDWYEKRCLQEEAELQESYLFALPEGGKDSISEEAVFQQIHRVMRSVIGDQQLRYHHLRHSFATWATLRLFLSDLETIPELFPAQPRMQEWLNQSKQFRNELYLSKAVTRKHLYAVASLLGHSGPGMSLQHYIHCMDLVAYTCRRERLDTKTLVKTINFSSGKLYKREAQKDKEKIIFLARDAALKATKKNKVRAIQLYNGKGTPAINTFQGDVAAEHDKSAECFRNLYTFLSVYSQQPGQDLALLSARFGFNKSTAQQYVDNATELASMTSRRSQRPRFKTQRLFRNGEKIKSIAPSWRLGGENEKEFDRVAGKAYGMLISDKAVVEGVCKYYINKKWGSRKGLVFQSLSLQDDALKYLQFLNELGFDEKRIQLSFFKGASVKVRRKWLSISNLKQANILLDVSPPNKDSKSLCEAVRVKVLTLQKSKMQENTQTPVIDLLMYLLAVLVLDDM